MKFIGKCDEGKPVAEVWYSVEAYDHNIMRFRESHIDSYAAGDIWLVRGENSSLVIDTGCGIINPAPLVQAVAGNPVTAVALNCYYDHSGGWHNFSERACHSLDAPKLLSPDVELAGVHVFLNEKTLKSLPWAGYELKDFTMTPAKPTRLVDDGDIFDLGGRSLEVLHMSGRTPGSLAIWEEATGSLFTSDMLYDGSHGTAWPPETQSAYCESIRRMRELPVKRVFGGHYGVFDNKRMLEIIDQQLVDLGQ